MRVVRGVPSRKFRIKSFACQYIVKKQIGFLHTKIPTLWSVGIIIAIASLFLIVGLSEQVKGSDTANSQLPGRYEYASQLSSVVETTSSNLHILNTKTNLTKGDIWKVEFETQGQKDLFITPIKNTDYETELTFVGIYCGDQKIQSTLTQEGISILNYSCNESVSTIKQEVTDAGAHWLETTNHRLEAKIDHVVESKPHRCRHGTAT